MTLNALGFPVVALPGVEHMHGPGEDEKEAVRVFYVAAFQMTQRLVIWVGGGCQRNMLTHDRARLDRIHSTRE